MTQIQVPAVTIIFSSVHTGQGKSIALCSYARPGVAPKRLVLDFEYRNAYYRSVSGKDEPSRMQYAFDLFGEFTLDTFIDLYEQVLAKKFQYNMVGIDNATMFQQALLDFVQTQEDARKLAKAFLGVYAQSRLFIETRFRATDAGGIYTLIKAVIGEFMRALRRAGIDVIITAQSHNVWKDYGKKSGRVLGQTAHLHGPWKQFADLVYMLDRSTESKDKRRSIGGAPRATADPFNPKHSVPTAPTTFTLSTWKDFWTPVMESMLPTEEEWSDVVFDEPQQPEYAPVTIPGPITTDEAKLAIANLAVEAGLMRSTRDGEMARVMLADAAKHDLSGANMLEKYTEWVAYIEAREAKAEEVADIPGEEKPWLNGFVAWAGERGLGVPEIKAVLGKVEGVELRNVSDTTLSHGQAKMAVVAFISESAVEPEADPPTEVASSVPHPQPDHLDADDPPF